MGRSFTLLRTLGEGAFGAVHLAEVRDEDDFVQTLAVKWLHPRWSAHADLVRRLRDEARLLGLLRHEHIVRVHGLTRIEGRVAILMEPIDGVDLARVGRAPPRVAAEICGAVADALSAAWSTVPPGAEAPLRVVHRDIKPSNVMITRRGAVKVMDFGVARATFDAREAHTKSQQFGTARYMAPERWLDGVAEAPSDVYSLGITLIELVRGQAVEQPRLSREGFAEDLDEALGGVEPEPLRALASRMCAFLPQDRPSAAEVAAACLSLAADLPGPDLRSWAAQALPEAERPPPAPTGTVVVEDTPVPTVSLGGPPPSPETRIALWTWVLPLVGALLVFGLTRAVRLAGEEAPPAGTGPTTLLAPPPEDAVEPAVPLTPEPGDLSPLEAPDAPQRSTEPSPTEATAPKGSTAPPIEAPPRPAPVEAPAPSEPSGPPAPPMSTVTFIVEPGLTVETEAGLVTAPRQAQRLAADRAHQLSVREGDTRWPCTIVVGAGPTTVEVRSRARGGCRQ